MKHYYTQKYTNFYLSFKCFKDNNLIALTQFDTKTRFELMASKGDKRRGLALLDKLERG